MVVHKHVLLHTHLQHTCTCAVLAYLVMATNIVAHLIISGILFNNNYMRAGHVYDPLIQICHFRCSYSLNGSLFMAPRKVCKTRLASPAACFWHAVSSHSCVLAEPVRTQQDHMVFHFLLVNTNYNFISSPPKSHLLL